MKYGTKCSAIYSTTIKTLFVASFPIILDVYCLDYYQLKEIVRRKRKKNEKFLQDIVDEKSFPLGDVQTRIANSNRATTKWIEGALSFFQSFLYFLTLKLNPFLLFFIFFLHLLLFTFCSSTLPFWLSIFSAFYQRF